MTAHLKIEFTVEPFVAGDPGPYVHAAVDAVRDSGIDPEIGPFGTSFGVDEDEADAVIGRVIRAAFSQGAERVSLQVQR